ncbi:hypothetical protein [Pseudomonas sp. BF-R-19]|uniref:hypothetical protein n=1 Tax=Pseudomonas sp. BF-R-19 TaxID=2832397 RepID=UPI001CBCB76A|nr:hypothetical protein [Pseudomonas sp. BF-R-19]
MVNRRQLLKLSALGTASFAAPLAYSASNITMAYNTGNATGSTSPKDLSDNARNLDHLVNGSDPSYLDRKGVPRKSWKGMEVEYNADQVRRETEFGEEQAVRSEQFDRFLESSGFTLVGTYGQGLLIERYSQYVMKDGQPFRLSSLASVPYTTTGDWATETDAFVLLGDDVLRQELSAPDGAELPGYSRKQLRKKIENVQGMLDTLPISPWEYAHLVTEKPDPDDSETWIWDAALNAMFASVPTGTHAVIKWGKFRFRDISIIGKTKIQLESYAEFVRVSGGVTPDGVLVENCQYSRFYFHSITTGAAAKPASWEDLTGAAVNIVDSNNNIVDLGDTTGFKVGVQLFSKTSYGVYFCAVHIGRARYTRYGVSFDMPDGPQGFINGNWVSAREFRGQTFLKTRKGTGQTDPFNGNIVAHINIEEADSHAIDLEFMQNNSFSNMRFENSPILGRWIKSSANCASNTYYLNRIPLDKLEIKERNSQFFGPIMNSEGSGAPLGNQMRSNTTGTNLDILTFQDSGSFNFDSNGTAVSYYIFGSHLGPTSAVDIGVTCLKVRTGTGDRRATFRKDGTGFADNANLALPKCINHVKVASNLAPVKLFLGAGDYYEGNSFDVRVTNFLNPIVIRNASDTADILPAGIINSAGRWTVYIDNGFGASASK